MGDSLLLGLPENVRHFANDNISEHLSPEDIENMKLLAEEKINELLDILFIDRHNDHNTQGTAKRLAKMYVDEVFKGRYYPQPPTTDFPNAKDLDQIYTLGPIAVRSTCSHHFVPIIGEAWVGVIPSSRVIGISKFSRLADWVLSRPQIQEEAVVQLADLLEEKISPKGLAIVIKAQHMCMSWRGVKEHHNSMTTSVMRGLFRDDDGARNEFLSIIKGQGY